MIQKLGILLMYQNKWTHVAYVLLKKLVWTTLKLYDLLLVPSQKKHFSINVVATKELILNCTLLAENVLVKFIFIYPMFLSFELLSAETVLHRLKHVL